MDELTVYPLFPDLAERVRLGEARSMTRPLRTAGQILMDARDEMTAGDPQAWRPRNLLEWIRYGGRGRR